MTYYAIRHADGKVIAEADGYMACSEQAFEAEPWGNSRGGEVAPYYLTTMRPTECSICDGYGYHLDYDERWECPVCSGSGYSLLGPTMVTSVQPNTPNDERGIRYGQSESAGDDRPCPE